MIYFIWFLTYVFCASIIIDECNKAEESTKRREEVNHNRTPRQNME